MLDLKHKVLYWLKTRFGTPPVITENSSFKTLETHYPKTGEFLKTKYHLDRQLIAPLETLSLLAKRFDLPPAQVLFMEIQLYHLACPVEQLTAQEAKQLMESQPSLIVLDVRESWERSHGSLPHSQPLNMTLLKTLKDQWPKHQPILIYCHFGIRSLDCASYLAQEGFESVYIIHGGIDAWSLHVDSSIPRYSGSYC